MSIERKFVTVDFGENCLQRFSPRDSSIEDDWSRIAIIVSFYLPVVFYSLIFEALLEGQTIGKRIMKIKVVKIDGYQASIYDYLVRWFFRLIDLNLLGPLFGPVVALIAIIYCFV